MDTRYTAQTLVEALGGKDNIVLVDTCMTRLRLTLVNLDLMDRKRIEALHKVLGLRVKDQTHVEIVFGPATIGRVATEFAQLIGRDIETVSCPEPAPSPGAHTAPVVRAGRRQSYAAQRAARAGLSQEDAHELERLFANGTFDNAESDKRLLVLNGPNLNLLGVREPEIYGVRTYTDLVALCQSAGMSAGFAQVICKQSNHEGVLVDEIQAARTMFDGIVLNPAAYTHTSVALLDALHAVQVPCVEVHISHVNERESFRQVSYVREACLATIEGEGFDGYVHAIDILATHLGLTD
jgi:3-dehydroquinate dehydratase-2